MNTLVTTEWLSQHLNDPDLVVLDCSVYSFPDDEVGFRNVSGRNNYEAGHLPSAGFADLTGDLCDRSSPYEFALPTPQEFCSTMGKLGVGDDSSVVLYAGMPGWAARVWWMLRWVGFDRVAILDGGLGAWTAEGRPLSTEPVTRAANRLTPAPRPELVADMAEVLAAIDDKTVSIIDALPEEIFRGDQSVYDRPGHIPGAKNIPMFAMYDESGRYLPLEDLSALFEGERDRRTLTYCGGGISASDTAFVMTRLGFTNVAVYILSLQEWATERAAPLVIGAH